MPNGKFGVIDYVVFALCLFLPLIFGAIFSVIKRNRRKRFAKKPESETTGTKEQEQNEKEKRKENDRNSTDVNSNFALKNFASNGSQKTVADSALVVVVNGDTKVPPGDEEKIKLEKMEKCKKSSSANPKTQEELATGSGRFHLFPVSLSLLGFYLNGSTVVGVPSEIYYNGPIFALMGFSWIIVLPITAHIFLPVFYKLRMNSLYEYLEKRFNVSVRIAGSLTYTATTILFLGVLLYAPVLCMQQVSTVNTAITALIFSLMCSIYVITGGLDAIIWVDVIQMFISISGFIALAVIGTIKVGGADRVWEIVANGTRNVQLDIYEHQGGVFQQRHTVWSQVIGNVFIWLPMYATNQAVIQRCLTINSLTKAKLVMYLLLILTIFMLILMSIVGLVMYAFYFDCHPLSGAKKPPDQIIQVFIMDLFGDIPGLAGLFTSSIFLAARGAIAVTLVSISTVFFEEFVKPIYLFFRKEELNPTAKLWSFRVIVIVFMLLMMGVSVVAPIFGPFVVEYPMTIVGMLGAPIFAVFFLAIFFRGVNTWGALSGLAVGLLVNLWMGIGGLMYGRQPHTLAVGTNCTAEAVTRPPVNETTEATMASTITSVSTTTLSWIAFPTKEPVPLQDLYDISYAWYGLIGFMVTSVVALTVSLLFNCFCARGVTKARKEVDDNLMAGVFGCQENSYDVTS